MPHPSSLIALRGTERVTMPSRLSDGHVGGGRHFRLLRPPEPAGIYGVSVSRLGLLQCSASHR